MENEIFKMDTPQMRLWYDPRKAIAKMVWKETDSQGFKKGLDNLVELSAIMLIRGIFFDNRKLRLTKFDDIIMFRGIFTPYFIRAACKKIAIMNANDIKQAYKISDAISNKFMEVKEFGDEVSAMEWLADRFTS